MKARTNNTTNTNTVDINTVAEEYKEAYTQTKALEPTLKEKREVLISHAKDNPALFVGNLLRHDNGTTIKKATRITPKWDEDKVSIDWLEAMLATNSAEALSISIDYKKLKRDDPDTAKLLAAIAYEEQLSTIWSVSVSTVENN